MHHMSTSWSFVSEPPSHPCSAPRAALAHSAPCFSPLSLLPFGCVSVVSSSAGGGVGSEGIGKSPELGLVALALMNTRLEDGGGVGGVGRDDWVRFFPALLQSWCYISSTHFPLPTPILSGFREPSSHPREALSQVGGDTGNSSSVRKTTLLTLSPEALWTRYLLISTSQGEGLSARTCLWVPEFTFRLLIQPKRELLAKMTPSMRNYYSCIALYFLFNPPFH